MKLKWVALFSLGMLAIQANAEQQMDASKTPGNSASAQADENNANKERVLKGGKMSPRQRAEVAKSELAASNTQTGDGFLAANKVKKGVVSLPSGVQYKILSAGKGNKPKESSTIACRYQGKLVDGTGFDKADEKKPIMLKVAGLLPGLKEAVKLMPAGSKWEIVIPPQLAYGAQGYRNIGPNAILIYNMEIVSVK